MTLPEKKAPYTFVPVVEDADRQHGVKPVFHDGATTTEENLYTGLLHCELTTLTPLLVGQYAYKVKDAEPNEVNIKDLDDDKTILEPLFLDGNPKGPVVLPGTGIKGMLRHNIGTIFNAPMERVAEQFFSHRPNLGWIDNPERYQCREAIVKQIQSDANGKITSITLQILAKGRHALYIKASIFNKLGLKFGVNVQSSQLEAKSVGTGNRNRSHRLIDGGNALNDKEYHVYCYRPGIDGEGELNEVQENQGRKDDKAVLVPINSANEANDGLISQDCIDQYQRTQMELADIQFGHRSRSDFKNRDRIWQRVNDHLQQIQEDQLIYMEIDLQSKQIVSFGQHFRYRWAYSDSICTVNRRLDNQGRLLGIPRSQVHPRNEELVENAENDCLTIPRALFGYVSGDNPGSSCLGEGAFERLAGRIAINHALEQVGDAPLEDRFVTNPSRNQDDKFDIPLKILGSPKASSVEHYLAQNQNKKLNTYGDLPGTNHSGSGTPLAGRKFYRHQKEPDFIEENDDTKKSNQSTLARYISNVGRKFRFTVRFKDLRDWELGAVLLGLNPDYGRHVLENIAQPNPPREGKDPVYANKLGHGRPLGLGSVKIDIETISVLNNNLDLDDKTENVQSYIKKAAAKVDRSNTEIWFKILNLNWQDSPNSADYPNAKANIYTYHTNIRADYSKRRRNGQNSELSEDFHEPVRP